MQTLSRRLISLVRCAGAVSVLLAPLAVRAADAPPTPTATATTSRRAPDGTERAVMLAILKGETAPERGAWFSYPAGATEELALADALAAIFREAGWKATVTALAGMRLKPGVSLLLAEEEPPAWTDAALRAMQASGIDVKSASGYRSYYEDKKKENAAWPGVPLDKNAAFVIVVGPEPKS